VLVKSELNGIPALAYPQFKNEAVKNFSFVGVVKIVNLPRSGNVFVADVFDKNERMLKLRFCSDGKNVLLCEEWPTENWFMRLPSSTFGYGNIYGTEEDMTIARDFLHGNCYGGIFSLGSVLYGFIHDIYSKKRQNAMDRKYAKMQDHFAMYPDLPADLPDYCEQHVFDHSYIFMDPLVKGTRHCVCGHCREHFMTDKGKRSGETGTCPKCGIMARYRGSWIKSTIADKKQICIAHKVDGQLLVRWANANRIFADGDPRCQYTFDDYYYNLHLNNASGRVIYAYAYQPNMGWGYNWYRKNNGEVNYKAAHLYTNNLKDVFGESYYRVNLEEGLRDAGEISFARLLDNLKNIPFAEYLFKLGLTQLVSTSGGYLEKLHGKSFTDVLGVSKQYLPLYRKFNITQFEHEIVKASKTWVDEESFLKFRALHLAGHMAAITDILEQMSFERFANYFTKQKKAIGRANSAELLIWYKDYISMCGSLGVDITRKSVRFPANIKTAHDVILERFNKVKHKIEDDNFAQAREKLYAGMKEYARGKYGIVFPKTRSDFITEGQSLKHCVGGDTYYKNHLKGERMVFFIRQLEEPSKPFFTMEIDLRKLKIVQLHGFCNCSAPADVSKFANEFLRRLSPAEKVAS